MYLVSAVAAAAAVVYVVRYCLSENREVGLFESVRAGKNIKVVLVKPRVKYTLNVAVSFVFCDF